MSTAIEPMEAPARAIGAGRRDTPVAAVPETLLARASRWSVYATIGALPLYAVRWQYGPVPTTLLETLIVLTVVLYAAARIREGVWRPVRTACDIPILFLLAAGGISVLVADDHRAALGLYRAYFIEPVALFYVAVGVLRDTAHLKRLVAALALGSSAFALLNLAVFYRALILNAVLVGDAPNALYGNANYVAMYMEPPFAVAVALLLLGNRLRWQALGAGWAAITGASLVATFSKGAYFAVAVLVLVAVVTVPRWRWALGVAVAAAVVVATQVPLLMARLATLAASVEGRNEVFGATLQMLRDNPLLGVGLGGYSYQFRGETPEVYPHNIWLTFWVEVGIVGAVAFAVILLGLLWRGWRAWPLTDGFQRVVLWGALGALVLWAAHGLVDSPYWKNDLSAEFWMVAAIVVIVLRSARPPRVPRRGHPQKSPDAVRSAETRA